MTGDVMYLNALGQPMLVINSLKAATELLDRRANIYSDRPRLIVAGEILCGGLFMAFMPYGEQCVDHLLLIVAKKESKKKKNQTTLTSTVCAALVALHATGSQSRPCMTITRSSKRKQYF
jgi:hypothetical protein